LPRDFSRQKCTEPWSDHEWRLPSATSQLPSWIRQPAHCKRYMTSGSPRDCAFALCPYPSRSRRPRGRGELSAAFCWTQHDVAGGSDRTVARGTLITAPSRFLGVRGARICEPGRVVPLPLADVPRGRDWKDTALIKARLAGCCLRAPAQGACPNANVCEHCPSFRAGAANLPVLAAQRMDAEALAADAERRGWIDEADRYRRLLARPDTLITQAQPG
jgi:hypothetical protein